MPRQLTLQEAHEFLDSKPGWIVLTTVGPGWVPALSAPGVFPPGRRNPHGRTGQHPEAAQHTAQP